MVWPLSSKIKNVLEKINKTKKNFSLIGCAKNAWLFSQDETIAHIAPQIVYDYCQNFVVQISKSVPLINLSVPVHTSNITT